MEKKKSNKKIIIAVIVGIVLLIGICIGMLIPYNANKKEPESGMKEITLQIESERDSYSFEEKYDTDEEYLGDFLDKEGIIGFDKSDYGRFITSVQGYEAKNEEQSWWSIAVNGESAVSGVDEIVIEDGCVYKLELKIGW